MLWELIGYSIDCIIHQNTNIKIHIYFIKKKTGFEETATEMQYRANYRYQLLNFSGK